MPLRVLHVTPSFFPAHSYGGPVTALYEMCRAQLAAGLEVRVLTSDAAGQKAGARQRLSGLSGRLVTDYGVPTLYSRVAIGEDLAPELLPALFTQLDWADVVHVTGLFSPTSLLGISVAVCAVGRRRPVVVSPRGSLLPWALLHKGTRKRMLLQLLSPLLRRVAGWHATSDEEAQAIAAQPRIVGEKAVIAVVANGIAVPPLFPQANPAPIILTLGRVHPVKNLELALAALAELRRHVPQAMLRVVGPEQPQYGAALREKARALKIDDAVQFSGELVGEAKLAALREASVLWLCSHMESFGNVVLEALAAGTPVVAAQTTPWPILPKLGVGRHVPPSPIAFSEATRELFSEQSDPARRAHLSHRCQAAVSERFAFSVVEPQLRSLYAHALRGSV